MPRTPHVVPNRGCQTGQTRWTSDCPVETPTNTTSGTDRPYPPTTSDEKPRLARPVATARPQPLASSRRPPDGPDDRGSWRGDFSSDEPPASGGRDAGATRDEPALPRPAARQRLDDRRSGRTPHRPRPPRHARSRQARRPRHRDERQDDDDATPRRGARGTRDGRFVRLRGEHAGGPRRARSPTRPPGHRPFSRSTSGISRSRRTFSTPR